MNLYNQKNNLHVFVCADAALTSAATLVTGPSSLNAGEVAFVNQDNETLVHATTAIAAGQTFRVVQCSLDGTRLHYSPWVNKNNLISKAYKAYNAVTQQITHLGYVGSGTGNIEAIDNNEYIVRILIENSILSRNKQMYKFGAYKSGNAATSSEVALGLTKNLWENFKREPTETILFEAISSVTTVASSGGTFAVTKGSTIVTTVESSGAAADAGKWSTDSYTLVVGDYIRFGHATTKTYPVYKITAITGAASAACTITLDRPYTGASNTALAASAVGCAAAADGLAATWGIQMTGIAATEFKAGVFDGSLVTFKVEPSNCGSTGVTYGTPAVQGNGTRAQVQELEWFAQGNLGNKWRVDTPPATMYDNTTAVTYNMYTLKFKSGTSDSVTGTTPESYYEFVFAIDDVSDTSGQNVYNHCANL